MTRLRIGSQVKGEATRARIVEATAERILRRGLGRTSLDDVQADTATSKNQLLHYFPGGKAELIRAAVAWKGERLLDVQRPAIDDLSTWESWEDWRRAILAYYGSLEGSGCPIGSLAAEAAATDPVLSAEIADYLAGWRRRLADGVRRLQEAGQIAADADADRLAASLLAAVQGGATMNQVERAPWPLEAALDSAFTTFRARGPALRGAPRTTHTRGSSTATS